MGWVKKTIVSAAVAAIGLTVVVFLTKDNIPKDTVDTTLQTSSVEIVNPLEKNQQDEIYQLIKDYYARLTLQDVDGLKFLMDKLDDNVLSKMEHNKTFLEGYENIDIYVKQGAPEDEYIVFAYYEMKIKDMGTLVPGLGTHYVKRDESGVLHIINGYQDSQAQYAIMDVVPDEDVQELLKKVQHKYTEAIESDKVLKKAIEDLQGDGI